MGGGYLNNPRKKKAYTLVELIGVLAVLSIMLIVIVPAILNAIKTNDRNKYKNFENIILQAAEVYVENNRDLYPDINTKGKAVVRVSYIISDGYLKSNLVDPSTKKSINPNTYVTIIKNSDETLTYAYGGSDCELITCPECSYDGYYTKEELDKALAEAVEQEKAKNPYNGYVVKFGSKTFEEVADMKGIPLSINYIIRGEMDASTKQGLIVTLNDGTTVNTDVLIEGKMSFGINGPTISGSGNLDLEALLKSDFKKFKNVKEKYTYEYVSIGQFNVIRWLEPISE